MTFPPAGYGRSDAVVGPRVADLTLQRFDLLAGDLHRPSLPIRRIAVQSQLPPLDQATNVHPRDAKSLRCFPDTQVSSLHTLSIPYTPISGASVLILDTTRATCYSESSRQTHCTRESAGGRQWPR